MSEPDIRHPKRPAFLDTARLPWSPWVMPGTHFKLLNVDLKSGGFTLLLKVDPDNSAPVHQHLGAVEAYILQGAFSYQDDQGIAGSYVYEAAGSIHRPESAEGSIMFAVLHGPLVGYADDGSIEGIVDGEAMLQLARQHQAADHLQHIQLEFEQA